MIKRLPKVNTFRRRIHDLGLEYDVLVIPSDRDYHIVKIIQLPTGQFVPHIRPDHAIIDSLYGAR
ncbi:MAG: hypothetical protein IJM41_11145, partial [Bacteroidales bacterium]|nr:hypothetical protein [Bacteroidales bacterium]